MKREYSTKQRNAILELLSESSSHVTAQEIAENLKKDGASVSLATIYRTLDKLEDEGIIKKMSIGNGASACYQYLDSMECNKYFHLKCTECGELIHLSCEFLSEMEEHIFNEHAFTISSGKTVIYGKCAKCCGITEKKCTCEGEHKH